MGQIIFTEFELQVLETARIVGGKGKVESKGKCNITKNDWRIRQPGLKNLVFLEDVYLI